jgi:hypothetical protein
MHRLAVATQQINNYTGTDYSGIEGLRREIKDHGISFRFVTCQSRKS